MVMRHSNLSQPSIKGKMLSLRVKLHVDDSANPEVLLKRESCVPKVGNVRLPQGE